MIENDHLETLRVARRALAILERQAAGYASGTIPVHLEIELQDKRQEVARLESQAEVWQCAALKEHHRSPTLPSRSRIFVGREREVASIATKLKESTGQYLIIYGSAALGKAAIAREVVEQCWDTYEGVVWINAHYKPLPPEIFMERISLSLRPHLGQQQPHERCTWLEAMSLLQRTPCLVVITKLLATDTEIIRFLDNIPEPSQALVTTTKNWGSGPSIKIGPLTSDDQMELVRKLAEQSDHKELLNLQQDELQPLLDICGGSPAVLSWAIGAVIGSGKSLEDVSRKLKRGGSEFDDIWESSYRFLSPDAQFVLHTIVAFEKSVARTALYNIIAWENARLEAALEQLLLMAQIQVEGIHDHTQRYHIYSLARQYVVNRLDIEVDFNQLRLQVADYLQAFAHQNGRENWERYPFLKDELGNILGSFDWCIEHQQWEQVLQLHAGIYYFLGISGMWREKLKRANQAVKAARALGRYQDEALILIRGVGWTEMKQGRLAQARQSIHQGLLICEPHNYLDGLISAKRYLGTVCRKQRQFEEATAYYEDALHLGVRMQSDEQERLMAGVYVSYGTLARHQGQYDYAQARYERALPVFQQTGNRLKVADLLSRIGGLLYAKGEYILAREKFEESQAMAEGCARQDAIAYNLYGLARLHNRDRNLERAFECILRSRFLFHNLGVAHEGDEDKEIENLYQHLKTSLGESKAAEICKRCVPEDPES
jgi:tetratricopeptide (TPR) repeat protein